MLRTVHFLARAGSLICLAAGLHACGHFECEDGDDSRQILRSVPVPAEYTGSAPAAGETAAGNDALVEKLHRQSFTIDPDDGDFIFNRSLETTVGYLGIEMAQLDEKRADRLGLEPFSGVMVRSIASRGPAESSALRPGDVIVKYNSMEASSPDRLDRMIEATHPGEPVELDIVRVKSRSRKGEDREETRLQLTLDAGGVKKIISGKGFQQQLAVLDDRKRSGLKLAELTEESRPIILGPAIREKGLLIVDTTAGGPGFRGDLRIRDYLIKVGQQPVASIGDYTQAAGAVGTGNRTMFTVVRNGNLVEAPVDLEEDATRKGGFGIYLLDYKSAPERSKFDMLFGLLFNYERCSWIRESNHASQNRVGRNWGAVLDLIEYQGARGGKKQIRIAWVIPIWWGRD